MHYAMAMRMSYAAPLIRREHIRLYARTHVCVHITGTATTTTTTSDDACATVILLRNRCTPSTGGITHT